MIDLNFGVPDWMQKGHIRLCPMHYHHNCVAEGMRKLLPLFPFLYLCQASYMMQCAWSQECIVDTSTQLKEGLSCLPICATIEFYNQLYLSSHKQQGGTYCSGNLISLSCPLREWTQFGPLVVKQPFFFLLPVPTQHLPSKPSGSTSYITA